MKGPLVADYPKISSSGSNRVWTAENYAWYIEEKLDGSQLSFTHDLRFSNRGRELTKPFGWMFDRAISALSTLQGKLKQGYAYHGECIVKPKHNVMHYGRVPRLFFVLFDVQDEKGAWLSCDQVTEEAERLGLERAQVVARGTIEAFQPPQPLDEFLNSIQSMLGGKEGCEGIVLKHAHFNKGHGKFVATKIKIVRDSFKEVHRKGNALAEKQQLTPEQALDQIMSWYPVEPRWQKAKQRLRDQGKITGLDEHAVKERGAIMDEARRDFQEEEEENLKRLLWAMFGQTLVQRITEGK